MIRILLIAALLFSAALTSYAQNDADVQRYTANYFSGTARFQSMGGAFGSLGGDMSALHINPAGVAVFRFGEISFTPAYEFNTINAVTPFASREESKAKMVVNNLGFVLANEIDHPEWRSVNFSVTYNRINTFNDVTRLTGQSTAFDGLAGDFLFEANGLFIDELNDFSAGLAYDAFVLDNANRTDSTSIDDGEYVMGFDQNELIETTQIAERDGRLSETALTIGANYDDRLYLGFGLGFQDITYASVIETRERPVGTPAGDLLEYTLIERLQSEGLGVNARLGVIYKLDNLRFGASVRTPTVFSMTDNFTVDITSRLQNPTGTFNPQSDADFFEYRIRTPWHFMGSVAGVIGKKAILSAQYERINFSGGELRNSTSSAETDFSGVNNFISQSYSASDIFRVGGEYRITKSFSARGGFAYFANPITVNEQQTDENLNRQEISFGLGYRVAAWYVDMSYSRATFNELYDYTDLNRATLENTQSVFGLTVGIRM
ncbi:MAG: hypothetical protein ACJAXD_000483 [Cryomorphaceae bacterium]|jgi:hypothetical protein